MNPEPSEQNIGTAYSVASLVKNASTVFVLCHLRYGPFLLFRASCYVQYTFLEDGSEDKNY